MCCGLTGCPPVRRPSFSSGPQEHQASAILHLAGSVHSAHICASRELAVEKGLKLRDQVRRGELTLPDAESESTSAG